MSTTVTKAKEQRMESKTGTRLSSSTAKKAHPHAHIAESMHFANK
jgi:hypothetical protein